MYNTVIFDFDGTVADTGKGVFNGLRYAFESLSLPAPSDDALRSFIGPPIGDSLAACGLDEQTIDLAVKKYREYYSEKGIYELELYPGVRETLEELKRRGITTAVGSSKPEPFLKRIAENEGLSHLFDYISGARPEYTDTSKTLIINTALDALGVKDRSGALMVGDRRFDVEGAKGSGIRCAAVLKGGYGSFEELRDAGADYIVDEMKDILSIVLK